MQVLDLLLQHYHSNARPSLGTTKKIALVRAIFQQKSCLSVRATARYVS